MKSSDRDKRQIKRLFEDGDRALISADIAELQRLYADDYMQYDESGKPRTKRELIRSLTSGSIRFISMRSTRRRIRLLDRSFAVVHGTEEDEIEQNAQRQKVSYCYLDVVVQRKGKWQIVASQLSRRI